MNTLRMDSVDKEICNNAIVLDIHDKIGTCISQMAPRGYRNMIVYTIFDINSDAGFN